MLTALFTLSATLLCGSALAQQALPPDMNDVAPRRFKRVIEEP
jgi:hypothetical protein